MKKTYKARPGFYLSSDEEAQRVGEFFSENFPTGEIKTHEVVHLAKPKTSPLHKYFEWDNKKAAEEFRLDQARKLIKAITIEIDGSDVPAYQNVHLESSDGRSYLDTIMCKESPDIWDQVIASALKEAVTWANRYKTYQELAPIVGAITEVKERLLNEKNRTKEPHRISGT